MVKPQSLTEQLEALQRCCDRYGADAARWPDAERAAFGDLLETEAAARILDDARMLDGFLNAATAPRMSEDLPRRIIAAYAPPKAPAGLFDLLRSFAPSMRLVPAGALAGLGALGVATGIFSASAQTPLTPEYEALAYLDDATLAPLDEEGELAWDAE